MEKIKMDPRACGKAGRVQPQPNNGKPFYIVGYKHSVDSTPEFDEDMHTTQAIAKEQLEKDYADVHDEYAEITIYKVEPILTAQFETKVKYSKLTD